jgi:hypothetical protein
MIIDASSLTFSAPIKTDICIVGAGIAGLSLASELEGAGFKIVLVESGDLEPQSSTQALYSGIVESDSGHPDLEASRFREVGGSCVKWGAYCIPFDPADFSNRGLADVGIWPFDYQELRQGFEKACHFLGIGSFDFEQISDDGILPTLARNKVIKPIFVKISPFLNFKEKAKVILKELVSTQVFTNTNLVEIASNHEGSSVEYITTKNLNGGQLKIEAKRYILAMGGLESVRMLLINQVGASKGNLGKHYSTHYQIKHGHMLLRPNINPQLNQFKINEITHERLIGFNKNYLEENKLLNMSMRLTPVSDSEKTRLFPFLKRSREKLYSIESFVEEPRDDRSQIELSDQVDTLGLPKIKLHHYLKPQMLSSINRGLHDLALEMGQNELGHIHIDTEKTLSKEMIGYFRFHHQGGAVMSKTSQNGVVDTNCKVFGINNLYINSSSVFPTAGHANPVLTQLALSYRLADHLIKEGTK